MTQYNMLEAKTNFSKIIKLLETKQEDEIIIARDNKPIAKIVLFKQDVNKRIGTCEGKYPPLNMELFKELDEEIEKDFYGE